MSDVEKMPDNPQPSKESIEAATVIAGEWWNADIESQDQLPKLRDLIALGIEQAYRRGRVSMREEAVAVFENDREFKCTPSKLVDAIRSLPLVEVKK